MADEAASTTAPDSTSALASAAAPAPSASPAGPAMSLQDFESLGSDAWDDVPLKGSEQPSAPAAGAPDGKPAPTDESAASSPSAETPEPSTDGETPLSRRQRLELEHKQELEAIRAETRAEIEREQAEKVAAEQAKRDIEADQKRRQDEALALLGPDDEFQKLERQAKAYAMGEGPALSWQDTEKLRSWTQNRDFAGVYLGMAERQATQQADQARTAFLRGMAAEAETVADRPGVNRDFVRSESSLAKVFDHFYTAGQKAIRDDLEPKLKEADDRIVALEAENRALSARVVGRAPRPATGGTSIPPTRETPFDIRKSVDDNLDEAFGPLVGSARR